MNLYLIDGNSYVYRAYFAIRGLTNSRGMPTNAIFGFTNMLLKIIRERKPDGLLVSFDSPVPTERHRLFEEYKAHRPEAPGDLVEQFPHIRKIISAMNIPISEIPGYEADDILGVIAKQAESKGVDVFIVTGDKDMLQIVDERIKVYDPMKDRVLDKEYVREKFGVGPERIPEFMALSGDAIDNIPGIKGVGEKTAKDLLSQFESIDDLLNNTGRIKKEKLRQLVAENADIVRLSRKLAALDTSVPVDLDMDALRMREPDRSALFSLFKEYEFTSLMKYIPLEKKAEGLCEKLFSVDGIRRAASAIKGVFAFDIEATSRNAMECDIVGLAFCVEKGNAFYAPIAHSYSGAPPQIPLKDVLDALSDKIEDEQMPKIGHNIKYDMVVLRQNGLEVRGAFFDTMIASYLLNPNKPNHSLEEVAVEYLSYRKKTFEEVLAKRRTFADVTIDEAAPYACDDARLSFELKDILFEKLRETGLDSLYFDIEMPLIFVLADMETAGVKVDVGRLREFSKEIERELDGITRRIFFLSGEEFNINSPKQLAQVLFENLGLQPGKRKKTGYSTEMAVLEELARVHELPREILNYRSFNKLKTTYIDVLPTLVNPRTGRVHTSFNQAATATGRLSSSEPNLQNIPVRGEWGRRIREAIIAEEHCLLLSADYSQIELRILAHLSGDDRLIDAFVNDHDIHAQTAAELFGTPLEKVSAEARRVAKTVNFGVIYGISPFGLSETLSISREEARQYIEQYFSRYPGVKDFIDRTIDTAKRKGYVETLFKRRRAVPELHSKNASVRQLGERLAVNSPIQGTAADIIKIAMIRIWRALKDRKMRSRLILQVHDELLLEIPDDEKETTVEMVRREMEEAAALSVPIRVSVQFGRNWAEAH
ncbi:MAG: DNA polymerase I [Nitrospirota bacterium]